MYLFFKYELMFFFLVIGTRITEKCFGKGPTALLTSMLLSYRLNYIFAPIFPVKL